MSAFAREAVLMRSSAQLVNHARLLDWNDFGFNQLAIYHPDPNHVFSYQGGSHFCSNIGEASRD